MKKMSGLEKKFKAYSKILGISEPMTLKELTRGLTDFDEYDYYLQYLGYHDKSDRELYEGDVVELTITDDLMKSSFSNSNMGKYIEEHPNVTSVVIEHKPNTDCLSMSYVVYAKVNGEFEYLPNKMPKTLAYGEDSMFPKYLAQKGAVYIGNTIETPYLIKQRPFLKQNDMIAYCRPFGYRGTCKTDGKAAVMSVSDGKVTLQFVGALHSCDMGNIEELPLDEILDHADTELDPLTLEDLMYFNRYQELFQTDQETICFYTKNYHVSEEDLDYLKKNYPDYLADCNTVEEEE